MLHPFMPFVTEEIWHQLGYAKAETETISHAAWPTVFPEDLRKVWGLSEEIRAFVNARHDLITAGRALRAGAGVPAGAKPDFLMAAKNADDAARLRAELDSVRDALGAGSVAVLEGEHLSGMPTVETALGTLGVKLEGLVDVAAEKAKVEEELAKLRKFLATVEAKLGNETFLSKAPAAIVEQQKARKAELLAEIERQTSRLASLG